MPVNTPSLGPGGTANTPVGLVGPTFIQASGLSDSQAVLPPYAFSSDASLGLYRSRASTIAMSYGTLDLFTNTVAMSMRTYADAPSGQSVGQWGIIQNASGMSV